MKARDKGTGYLVQGYISSNIKNTKKVSRIFDKQRSAMLFAKKQSRVSDDYAEIAKVRIQVIGKVKKVFG